MFMTKQVTIEQEVIELRSRVKSLECQLYVEKNVHTPHLQKQVKIARYAVAGVVVLNLIEWFLLTRH